MDAARLALAGVRGGAEIRAGAAPGFPSDPGVLPSAPAGILQPRLMLGRTLGAWRARQSAVARCLARVGGSCLSRPREGGQAAVEAALLLPLLALVLLALVQVVLVAGRQVLVIHVARDAARRASVGESDRSVQVRVEQALGGGAELLLEPPPSRRREGEAVRARVRVPVRLWAGPWRPTVVLSATVAMRLEWGAGSGAPDYEGEGSGRE